MAACYPVTHFAVHCLSSDYVFFAECPTFKTIFPVFHHDGPRRVPRVVSEYPRFDLVAPFRSHLLRVDGAGFEPAVVWGADIPHLLPRLLCDCEVTFDQLV